MYGKHAITAPPPTICSIENNTPTYSEKAVGVLSKLKSKLAAVGSTEIVLWTLVSTVVATGVGLGVKAVTTGENGVMSNIEERINNAPDKIMNGSGDSGTGGSEGGDLIPQTPSYGTLTKSWDISEAQDGSVTMDYYDDTKTAVVKGNGDNISNVKTKEYIGNNSIEKLYFDNSITSINSSAFTACISLTSITIPNSVENLGDYTFRNCRGLVNVILPNNLTAIGQGVFNGCRALTTIIIPNSVKSIDKNAFSGCQSLTNINLPDNLEGLETGVFSGCVSLTNIVIPNMKYHVISPSLFSGCTNLTSITLPTVTSIGLAAFKNCNNLTDIYYKGNQKDWNETSIGNENECLTNATIHYNS